MCVFFLIIYSYRCVQMYIYVCVRVGFKLLLMASSPKFIYGTSLSVPHIKLSANS